jgi:acetoin utilization protein AcuB
MLVQSQIFKKPVTIESDEPIHKAIKLIFNHGVSLLPVVKKKKLIGVVSERDVLTKLLPTMKEFIENATAAETFESIEKKLPDYMLQPVNMIMRDNPQKVMLKTPLLKAQSIMLLHKIHRLPVVNKKNEVIGIISQADIFKALAGQTVSNENDQFHEWYASFYELIEPTSAKEGPEIKPLDKLFTKHNVYRVVDIFTGSGGHAIALGQRSYEVLGLNKFKHFHEAAIKKLEHSFSKDYRGTKPSFLCGDYLKLLQERNADFDAAMLMGNALSHHVESYKDILQALDKSLVKKDALLVVVLTKSS